MFDLEKAIRKWRRSLQKKESLEDGSIAELEGHLRDKIDDLVARGESLEAAFESAVRNIGSASVLAADFSKTGGRRGKGSRWDFPLIPSYLKTAFRRIRRQKVYSLINIIGLAAGLACCAVIILYVTNELTYDTYHPDADRMYRIATHRISLVGEFSITRTPGPLGPELENHYPQVERAVRIVPPYENADHVFVAAGEKRFFENRIWFADADIFHMFQIPFIYGSSLSALHKPYAAVITEDTARKYFGDVNSVGETLTIEIDYDTGFTAPQDFEVTGIVRNAPSNTHFKYDILLSLVTHTANVSDFNEDWLNPKPKYTYVKLLPAADAGEFEKQIQQAARIEQRIYEKELERKLGLLEYFLQPVTRIHMHSRLMGEMEASGSWSYVYIYSIVAFLILLIGCMNFMNLSAALSATRTKEVGLRKVVGAHRGQLVRQFLGESFLVTLISFIVSFGLMRLLLYPFNRMAGTELSLAGLGQPVVLAALAGLLILVGLGSGGYPAFILTAFKPVSVLQGKLAPASRGTMMQKIFVLGQFTISIFLVICTLTVFRQLDFMQGRSLGFDLDQKLVLRIKSHQAHFRRDYNAIKQDFLQSPLVQGATVSSFVPGDEADSGYYLTPNEDDLTNAPFINVITMDCDFIPEFGIEMVAGRPFQRDMGSDENNAYIINRAAVKELGFSTPEEALGKRYMAHYHRLTKQIIGVVGNFHYRGMQEEVGPLILDIEDSLMDTVTLSVRMDNMKGLMAHLRDVWESHFPGVPFEYSFLDDDFDRQYWYEKQMGRLLGITTTQGLVIACLGLFGLALFITQYRTKEIGIRKVLGASPVDIAAMLSKKFVQLILLAALIASPLALYSMNRWLQDFAYRIDVAWTIFPVAAGGALLIALATIWYQGLRAAGVNPVNSLRNE